MHINNQLYMDLCCSNYKAINKYNCSIIIHFYQLGTGGHTQKAEPVGGVYPKPQEHNIP